ncbi:MAG: thioredoxin family protein [Gemmatimonadetes bacterium]|nr:thioredoxin family protein [Gemmatimonadota bacterium]
MFVKSSPPGTLVLALTLLLTTPVLLPAQAKASNSVSARPAHVTEDFTEARFKVLQKEGALILVDVWASWCPTCAKQQEVLTQFRADNPGVPLHTLTVNFDTQKEWVKFFRAPRQSTMILYRGTKQVWFAVAETRSEKINAELLSAAGSK